MRNWHRLLIIGLGVIALAAALALIAPWGQDPVAANGTIHYVDADATSGGNNGSSWADAFIELQSALDVALSGDEIWVAAGTYKPTAEHGGTGDRYKSFQLINGVALYGGFDPDAGDTEWEDRDWEGNPTVLSGDLDGDDGPDFANNDENSYHVFYHPDGTNLDGSAVLDGFTISGGNANGDADHCAGGGMYNENSSPALTNCTFAGNSTDWYGGGMYNVGSSPAVTNCAFSGNDGAGMYNENSSPTLANCTFSGNDGRGMSNNNYSSPSLTNCTFSGNDGGGMGNNYYSSPVLIHCTFDGNSVSGKGGGMWNGHHSSPTLTDCTFQGNSADWGGGMYNGDSSAPDLVNSTFVHNSAGLYGGGIYDYSSSPALTNCTFAGNSAGHYGGGMFNYSSSPTLTNCAFSSNSADYGGGGMYNCDGSSPTLTNCILWGNHPNQVLDINSTSVVTYSDVQGGYPGEGNIDTDPLFVNPDNGDFHLGSGSPCIDAGDNAAPNLPLYDFEGDDRILDGDGNGTATVDIGVDEMRLYYVDADATIGANDGSSWGDAFTEMQPALDVAASRDQIWVAEGSYTPSWESSPGDPRSAAFQMKNGVVIYGGFDPTVGDTAWEDRDWEANLTILSGDIGTLEDNSDNSYHVFYHPASLGLDNTAILDGFTISGGNADNLDLFPNFYGGGMYNYSSSPTLSNCTFEGNSSGYVGGGMANLYSSPALTNCTFRDNSADSMGGGMYNEYDSSSPTLSDCTFEGNSAGEGGGMHNEYGSSPTLFNCTFEGNSADSGWGGGMYNFYNSSPVLTNCTFIANIGSGMANSHSSAPTLIGCTFEGNSAGYGGGMRNSSSSPTLANCTFWGNTASQRGGALYNGASSPTLISCTFSGNSAVYEGSGIYNWNSSAPTLTNCILWGHAYPAIENSPDSTPVVTYSDVEGSYPGVGNILADPQFVDPGNGDFHLGLDSPCIDAGTNDAPDLPEYDFEGDARVLDGDGNVTRIVDMGVDEVAVEWPYFYVHLPVVLKGY